jgi:hypothetical protein
VLSNFLNRITVWVFHDPEPFHLFMMKHQVRDSLSQQLLVCKVAGITLECSFPWQQAERKARERKRHDLAGIFMLLERTWRLLEAPGVIHLVTGTAGQ